MRCTVPPRGWYCTREPGHSGPCAAHPNTPRWRQWAFIAFSFVVCCTDSGRHAFVGALLRAGELIGASLGKDGGRELSEAEKADVERRVQFFDAPR